MKLKQKEKNKNKTFSYKTKQKNIVFFQPYVFFVPFCVKE